MALDEALLESASAHTTPPTLRLYAWEPACLSLGYAQPYGDVDEDRLGGRGWDVVRRPTGGRAILHTDEITYSVTAAMSEPMVAGSLLESYGRLAEALLYAVRDLGLNAELGPVANAEHAAANPVCFEAPSAYEILVDGKKLIGSAQARRMNGVLQHGALPLTGDLGRITEVLAFPDPRSRADASVRLLGRATTVESALGRIVQWDEAARAVVRGFECALDLQLEPADPIPKECARAGELEQEKFGNKAWTQRV